MKILQISANWGRGGPGGVEKDIYDILCLNGDECAIAYGRYNIPEEVNSIKIGGKLSVYKSVLSARLFDNAGFANKKETKRFVKDIVHYNPDIIHIHNLLGYYLNINVLFTYLKECKKPIVWTVHDCWPFTGHCINFERINCKKWVTGCYKCPLKNDYPSSILCDNSRSNWMKKNKIFGNVPNMTLVVPSNWLKTKIKQSFLSGYNTEVIHNGIDLNIFHPIDSDILQKYKIQNKIVLLAIAGVWNEMKGEKLLYQIADLLSEEYVIVMIGTQNRTYTHNKIIKIDRTENISELVKWYSMADVFINPTLGDNYPTVNLEAMACGTPIVTNNTGGSAEAAGDRYGRIVFSKTPMEFVEKIKECVAEHIERESIIEAAKKFDKKSCFKKYIDLYTRIIE